MESIHGTCKASKFASEDIISRMPESIMSNILDRLPIQDAVKTGILSRNWRFSWTMRSQLVFDEGFFKYLRRKNTQHLFNKENLGSVLLHLKGSITKFVLHIPRKEYADIADDIGQWILFLSTKGLKEFVLINEQGSKIFQLMSFLPKLEELDLDFYTLRFLDMRVRVTYPCLKTLTLGIDFDSKTMVSSAYDLINSSPNLQTLKIMGSYSAWYSLHPHVSGKVDRGNGITGKLQLQDVELDYIRTSENEVCFIKSLLANSPLLKKMAIAPKKPDSSFVRWC